MTVRLGLFSLKVVLPQYFLASLTQPSPALILIEDERISNVVEFPDTVLFADVAQQYAEWRPRDLGNLCVSPGLVDCNVQVNGKWDGVGLVSRAAVSGGVTFLLVEPSLYRMEADFTEEICCDVARVAVVGIPSLDESISQLRIGAFALKAYMFPPSAYVNGVAQQLQSVLDIALEEDVPVIIDASYPSPRMLYMASPCRLMPLEDRAKMDHFSEDKFFAGAFPEEIDPYSPSGSSSSSSEEEENEEEFSDSPPQPFASGFTSPIANPSLSEAGRASIGCGFSHISKKIHTVKSFEIELKRPSLPSNQKFLRVPTMVNVNTRRRSFQCHNIYEDLQRRIEANQGNIENLSTIELMAYEEAGETKFGTSGGRKRSNSISDKSPKLEVLTEELRRSHPSVSEFTIPSPHRDRFQRPTGLQISRGAPSETSKDRLYIYHIANHPDHWETNGVVAARKAISVRGKKGYTGKIHFCNLSSAAAFAKVGRGKSDLLAGEQTTTETSPSYLYFTMEGIAEGDTRFKMMPPIRSKTNCNLLWDLLKMEQIDILASHHSYIPDTYKFLDSGSFKKAVNGITALGHSLQTVWTKLRAPVVESRNHYLVRMSKWMSLAPAKMLGVAQERGSISQGKYADLVLWDPESPSVSPPLFPSPSPYSSEPLLGKVHQVYVRGQLAYDQGLFFPVGRLQSRSRPK